MNAYDQHCRRCAEQINHGEFDLFFANASIDYAVTPIGRYVSKLKILYLPEPYRLLYEANPVSPWVAPVSIQGYWHSPHQIRSMLYDFFAVQWLRIQAREELLNAQVYDQILVNSYYSRECVLRVYGLDSKVGYSGIDTQKFVYRHQPREKFIIGVGAITPAKNIRFVIEALANVSTPRPVLTWVGNFKNPIYYDEIQKLAQSVGVVLDLRVMISDEELVDLLNRAAMMVYTPRLEPFGFAPLEANACGTPVLSVAEGGIRETVIDGLNGLLIENDALAMAAAIERLLNNPVYARQLGENGVKWVNKKYSLNSSIDRLETHFAQLMNAHPHRPRIMGFDKNDYWKAWRG
jgi:glycosyltransferase involved in cell wall biosynthesis